MSIVCSAGRVGGSVPAFVDVFRDVALRHADRVAVEHGNETLTYRQLDEFSDALARSLMERGLGEGPLGLLANRSLEMVVAVLAATKLGCGYVPLDPMYPSERLRYMLGNSGARVLLAHDELVDLVAGYDGSVLSLTQCAGFSDFTAGPCPPRVGNLGYV
ncbi:MAG: AMP-binding protein, partial [Myxococcales bacterium]